MLNHAGRLLTEAAREFITETANSNETQTHETK